MTKLDLESLSDDERLILGLRLRLKHIRLALEDVAAGRVPDGFDFPPNAPPDAMLAELQLLEADVLGILQAYGTGEPGSLN